MVHQAKSSSLFKFQNLVGGLCMVWTARQTYSRSMSSSMTVHQRNLARQSLHLWSTVQSRLRRSLLRWRFCSCCWRVRSRGVKAFPSSFFGIRNNPRNVVLTVSKGQAVIFIPRDTELVSLSLSIWFCQGTCDTRTSMLWSCCWREREREREDFRRC